MLRTSPEQAEFRTLQKVADDVGGSVREIRGWIKTGEVSLHNPAAALGGHVDEDDFRFLERRQIETDISRLFKDPEGFLSTPLERFAGKTPREMLGTADLEFVRDIVWNRKAGAF